MMDDRRLGLVLRAVRRKRGWRQRDLSDAAGVSQSVVSRAEAGHFDTLSVRVIRRVFAALDVRLDLNARWRGGELDRLIDSRHAAIVATAATVLAAEHWTPFQEVTYAIYRERGSIDLLGVQESVAAAVVMEIKSEITSWEETQRRFDEKARLLSRIVYERFGWQPRVVGRVIVLEESMTNRRRAAMLGAAAQQTYPARGREIRRWLRHPSGSISGLWFLSAIPAGGVSYRRGGSHRVRTPGKRSPSRHGS